MQMQLGHHRGLAPQRQVLPLVTRSRRAPTRDGRRLCPTTVTASATSTKGQSLQVCTPRLVVVTAFLILVELSLLVQGTQTQTQSNIVAASGLTADVKAPQSAQKPRIVILGSGWGAMSFIKNLSKKDRYNSLCGTSNVAAHEARCWTRCRGHQCNATSRLPVCKITAQLIWLMCCLPSAARNTISPWCPLATTSCTHHCCQLWPPALWRRDLL